MKRRLRRLPPLTFRYSRWLLLMLFPVVKCQARRTELLIAELAMSGMGVAQVSAAIKAFCHGIAVARIANRVLDVRYFDNSALHALALYFDLQGQGRRKSACLCERLGDAG